MIIHTKKKNYATSKAYARTFDYVELGLEERGWVWSMLLAASVTSEIHPLHHTTALILQNSLRKLSKNVSWRSFVNRPASELTVNEIADGYRLMELALSGSGLKNSVCTTYSMEIRQRANQFFRSIGLLRIERIHSYFRSAIPKTTKAPRELIADAPSEDQSPVSALSHESIPDLKKKLSARLRLDFEKIENACSDEFAQLKRLRTHFDEASKREVDADLADFVARSSAGCTLDPYERRSFGKRPLEEFEAAYVQLLRQDLRGYAEGPISRKVRQTEKLILRARTIASLPPSGAGFQHFVLASEVGFFSTLVAALVIIQMRTAWNVSAVLELTAGDIVQNGGQYHVQGFKSKTDDFTPDWIVRSGDENAIGCLRFLLERLDRMKEMGWVVGTEQRLWLRPFPFTGTAHPLYQGWPAAIRSFASKHSLPKFSAEQIRNQALSIESLDVGGLEASRRLAGHRNLQTTAKYVDQLLLYRFNAAVNLEFQRRLEKSVEYRLTASEAEASAMPNDLLYSLGDGSKCSNPYTPPKEEMLDGKICKGHACHAESGCPNLRIEIDAAAVEQVVRTRVFYEGNWQRLLDENESLFRAQHFSRFMFVMALEGVLRRGSHRGYLKQIQKMVNEEFAHEQQS